MDTRQFGLFLNISAVAAVWIVFGALVISPAFADQNSYLDLFHLGDDNNDTSLSMAECSSVWMTLDVDGDEVISKIEFAFKWTFSNLQFSHNAPMFMRLVDIDFSGTISKEEITKLCSFFDDDENGQISQQEFEFTWRGLFQFSPE